jgi:signal transduction histidine kinase
MLLSEMPHSLSDRLDRLAHQLNSPLAALISNLSLLTDSGQAVDGLVAGVSAAVERLRAGESAAEVADDLGGLLQSTDLITELSDLLADALLAAERTAELVATLPTVADELAA